MRWKKTLAALVAISISGLAYGGSVTPRTPYATGDPITAGDINTDFDNIHTAVNDNNTRIGTNISSINTITSTTIPGVSASIPTSVNQLTDVDTAGAVNGKILKHNGSIFVVADDDVVNSLNGLSDVNTSGLITDSVLKYNGSGTWIIGTDNDTNVTSIFGLTDVIDTGNADGKVLKWDNENSRFAPADDVGAVTITDLDNVGYPGSVAPTDGQVLKWQQSSLQWIPGNDEGGTGSDTLVGLTDTDLASSNNADMLTYINGAWRNRKSGGGAEATETTTVNTSSDVINAFVQSPNATAGNKTTVILKNIKFPSGVRIFGFELSSDFGVTTERREYHSNITVRRSDGDKLIRNNHSSTAWFAVEDSGNNTTGIKELKLTITEPTLTSGTFVKVEGILERTAGADVHLIEVDGYFSQDAFYDDAIYPSNRGDISAIRITPGTTQGGNVVTPITNIVNGVTYPYTYETYIYD